MWNYLPAQVLGLAGQILSIELCPFCNGRGYIRVLKLIGRKREQCPFCDGGKVIIIIRCEDYDYYENDGSWL
jgi:hypothetical protein